MLYLGINSHKSSCRFEKRPGVWFCRHTRNESLNTFIAYLWYTWHTGILKLNRFELLQNLICSVVLVIFIMYAGRVPTLLDESDSLISSRKSYLLGNLNVLLNTYTVPCKGRYCARDVAEHMLAETVQTLKLYCVSLCALILSAYEGLRDTWWCCWLRHCATSRKVAGSITNSVFGIFHWHNTSGSTMALGSTQPQTEVCTRNISWGVKAAGA